MLSIRGEEEERVVVEGRGEGRDGANRSYGRHGNVTLGEGR